MSSAKGKVVRLLGKFLLKRGRVVRAEDVGNSFRRVEVSGDFPRPKPGDKVQLLLPSDDVRTYTPIASSAGSFALLAWKHAGGPGARWVADVAVGTEVAFAGPDRSLDIPSGPLILVGDETSVAVAASFEGERRGVVRAIFQGRSEPELRAACASVGLSPAQLSDDGDTEAIVRAVLAARDTSANATVAVTGGSELILRVRSALRERGIRDVRTKSYWVPGKSGLD